MGKKDFHLSFFLPAFLYTAVQVGKPANNHDTACELCKW